MKKLIYSILEVIFKKGITVSVSGIKIKLPFRYHRYYEHNYEFVNINYFRQTIKKGDVVIDIGAQLGLMTKLFADLVRPGSDGKVYSFEPTPKTFKALLQTIKLNEIGEVVVPFQQAISDKKGSAVFNISNNEIDAANSLANVQRGTELFAIQVDINSIDSLVQENSIKRVNFIKIDAEGAEYNVLVGARNTILKHRPNINLALHPKTIEGFNSSLKEIWDFVMLCNYSVYSGFRKMEENEFINTENLFDVQLIPIKLQF